MSIHVQNVGRGSLVYIAKCYGRTFRGLNPGGGEIFHTHTNRLWGCHFFLHNGNRISLTGVKRPEHGVEHPPTSSAEVKEREKLLLYLYCMACSRVKFPFFF